jgi:hypothetical protein
MYLGGLAFENLLRGKAHVWLLIIFFSKIKKRIFPYRRNQSDIAWPVSHTSSKSPLLRKSVEHLKEVKEEEAKEIHQLLYFFIGTAVYLSENVLNGNGSD